jgi:hypothetical protein
VPLLSTSLSPYPVSILSTPHFRSSALMPCAYPHAKIRFVLIFSCTRSLALYLCSLSQEYIDARRPRREAADGSRHRIEYYLHRLSELRESRGRRGARDASVDAALAHACVRACLVLARSRLDRQLCGRVGCRGHGPAFRGHRRGRSTRVGCRQLSATRPPGRLGARDVTHGGVEFWRAARGQQVLFSRALRSRKWQYVEWTSRGQCAVVFGWCWATQ